MKRAVAIALLILYLGVLSACAPVGRTTASAPGTDAVLSCFVILSAPSVRSDAASPVVFELAFGHGGEPAPDNLLGHKVEVFMTQNVGNPLFPTDATLIYERSWEGEAFLVDEWRCRSARSCPSAGDVSIDFGVVAYDQGLVVARLTASYLVYEDVEGEILERVATSRTASYHVFILKDGFVFFGNRETE